MIDDILKKVASKAGDLGDVKNDGVLLHDEANTTRGGGLITWHVPCAVVDSYNPVGVLDENRNA
jgi:hypothetical protein